MPNYTSHPNIDLHLEIYRLAARRVRARLVFRYHLCACVLGSSLLVAIYLAPGLFRASRPFSGFYGRWRAGV